MNAFHFKFIRMCTGLLLAALAVCSLVSCSSSDGGTSGTGLRTYQGKVLLPNDAPLTTGTLTVLEDGDSAKTDSQGQFTLLSSALLSSVNLRIQSNQLDVEVPINNIPQATTQVDLELHVDPATNTAQTTRIDFSSVQEFALHAEVVDNCQGAFTNESDGKIVQLGPIKTGLSCTVKATVLGDGDLQGGVLVGIERRTCEPNSPWRSITSAITPTGTHRGVVKIPFR